MDSLIDFFSLHTLLLILLIGWSLDLLLGDPARLPHPVVYMGRWISFWERRLNHGKQRRLKGAVFSIASIVTVFGVTHALWRLPENIHICFPFSCLHTLLFAVLTFFCLAGRTLRHEVRMVFEALEESLDKGRRQVARIVGRDTEQLSAQEVRTAALETLAENLSDGVIAPLFWFALLGVPGMMAYKMINTLDSMIGYRNERYKDFGCWAAHIDDIANYIPARITALLLLACNALLRMDFRSLPSSLAFLWRNARRHASPNSGWPEAALASILDCQFGGTHNYFGQSFYKPFIGDNPRPLTCQDMRLSIRLCLMAESLAVAVLCCLVV